MAFWISILFAAGGATLAYKKTDFYRMWAILFNTFIAIYLSVMLSPWIISMIPSGTSGLQYQKVACIVAIAVLVFGILQAVTVNFITTDADITFPKLFDSIGVATLGFIGGWFVSSFILLMICIMPFANKPSMDTLTEQNSADRFAVTPIVALCDLITAVSIQPPQGKPRFVINELINPKATDDKNEPEETDKSKLIKAGDTYTKPELNDLE
ncbi:MAG: hypothetical protein K9M75_13170 [Phycisphaerae bacterium]|nr:hypothetical protein [Phycisphaerae bacterium]